MTQKHQGQPLSPEAFAAFGPPGLVYVKPVVVKGQRAYGLFSGDGTEIAAFKNREVASAMARRENWEPVSAH